MLVVGAGGSTVAMRGVPRTVSTAAPEAARTAHESLTQQSREQRSPLAFIELGPQFLTYKKIGVPIKQELYTESGDRKK